MFRIRGPNSGDGSKTHRESTSGNGDFETTKSPPASARNYEKEKLVYDKKEKKWILVKESQAYLYE